MFKPKYLMRLKNEFSADSAMCLGSQLKSIVRNVDQLMESPSWLGADVDAISPIPKQLGIDSFRLKKIGNSDSLINLCENINQFLSGVFIAVKNHETCEYPDTYIGTEDEEFRALNLDGVFLEIRTFDTSYFEMYFESNILLKDVSKIYPLDLVLINEQ
jgi:hypothetical protein